jgi:hypothetical protein
MVAAVTSGTHTSVSSLQLQTVHNYSITMNHTCWPVRSCRLVQVLTVLMLCDDCGCSNRDGYHEAARHSYIVPPLQHADMGHDTRLDLCIPRVAATVGLQARGAKQAFQIPYRHSGVRTQCSGLDGDAQVHCRRCRRAHSMHWPLLAELLNHCMLNTCYTDTICSTLHTWGRLSAALATQVSDRASCSCHQRTARVT